MDLTRKYVAKREIFADKERYKTLKPDFGFPNIFHLMRAKKYHFEKIADELNDISITEYTNINKRPVISFAANINKKYKRVNYVKEREWAQNYVLDLVNKLQLIPDLTISTTNPPVVYVPLDIRNNLNQMRHISRYIAFEQYSMLTLAEVKKLKRKIR